MKWDPFRPDALEVLDLEEARAYAHDGCSYCDALLGVFKLRPKWKAIVNTESRDIIAVIP